MKRNVVIIGAGPAGLTAAFKLTSEYSDQFNVFVIEKESTTGGLSKTVSDGVMSLDIGGHRFFTDNAAPPRVSPSNLVNTTPSIPNASLNFSATFTAS